MPKEVVRTELAPRPLGDYSQARAVSGGKLIFVAGQVSVDMEGKPVRPVPAFSWGNFDTWMRW